MESSDSRATRPEAFVPSTAMRKRFRSRDERGDRMLREMKSVSIIFIFIFFPHESLNFGIVFKIRILFVIVDGSLRVVFFFSSYRYR